MKEKKFTVYQLCFMALIADYQQRRDCGCDERSMRFVALLLDLAILAWCPLPGERRCGTAVARTCSDYLRGVGCPPWSVLLQERQ